MARSTLLMAGVAVLLIAPVVLGVRETAPRIVARRGHTATPLSAAV